MPQRRGVPTYPPVEVATAGLPPRPWRYTLTPTLLERLVQIGVAQGELNAAPLNFHRRRDELARARHARVFLEVKQFYRSVTMAEVESVFSGEHVRTPRNDILNAIRHAVVAEDAFANYAHSETRLTPELAVAYASISRAILGMPTRWLTLNPRERAQVLALHRRAVVVPQEVRDLFAWVDGDAFLSKSAPLRMAALFWLLNHLLRWPAIEVLHHELRATGLDRNGFLVTSGTGLSHLVVTSLGAASAREGDFTEYFELFAEELAILLRRMSDELGRLRHAEEHLPWEVVSPPDQLDADVMKVLERTSNAGSATIAQRLGRNAPPLRTLQRLLSRLVRDGLLLKRGGRKNATYSLPIRTETAY